MGDGGPGARATRAAGRSGGDGEKDDGEGDWRAAGG